MILVQRRLFFLPFYPYNQTKFFFLKVKKEIMDLTTEIKHVRSEVRALSEKVEVKAAIKPHMIDILLRIINYL